ncbi:TonB-dependent siderophore receptor [Pigmentiphaga aceris]|uniref:TonB-dependent siderophore receptor n=1 Tax=Pigmentiphaga aceris TaxID=1940612 RepID=A0A5C0AXN4_9BURK|nr:TonB-dependent siderophore receptor [Pigmentiphaga aceris]QEI07128.1 TonB-dependent siderophore receptor [Pigmentiphaga aceris]
MTRFDRNSALSNAPRKPLALVIAIRAALACGLLGTGAGWAQTAPAATGVSTLTPIAVTGDAIPTAGDTLPPPAPGGQIARGGRLGVLGEQDAADVPFSVTSYTSALIESQQARNLSDVLKNNPSVQSSYGFGNFAEVFVVRGFPLLSEDVSFGGLYGIAPRQVIATQMIERVEVLLGANAFLSGASPSGSGIGGAINVEPKRAGDTPLNRFSVDYTSDSQVGGSLDVARRFGPDQAFGVRVNALQRSGDTGIDREDRNNTIGSIGLDYRGDKVRTSFDLGYQRLKVNQGRTVTYLGSALQAVPETPNASHNSAQDWSFSDLKSTFGMLRGEVDLSDSWTAYAGVGASRNEELGTYSSPTVAALNGAATASRLSVPFESDSVGAQFGVRGKVRTGPVSHSLNLGYSGVYRQTRTAFISGAAYTTNLYNPNFVTLPRATSSGGNFNDPGMRSRTRMHGLSVSDTIGVLDDRLLFTLGARRQSIDVQGFTYTGVRDANYNSSVTSPVYGVVFKPWDQVSIYANHIEGLQQGPTAPNSAANAGQVFAPYTSKQNEIGIKLDRGNFGAGVALYEIEQPSAITDSATRIYSVDGLQRNRGLELTVYGEPVRGVRVLGGIAFNDAKLKRTAQGTNNGHDAVGVPDYQATAGVEWDVPGVAGLTAQGQVVRVGPQAFNASNSLRLKAWTRVDLGVAYSTKVSGYDVVWRANVENVADRGYWNSATGGYLTQGAPRTFKLSATMGF